MTSLYETLGVRKGASKAEIRAAYRKKAKAAHPDTGGDKAKFNALALAHDILSDEDRRERYDQTGDTSEKKVDNTLSEAASILGALLDQVLTAVYNRGGEPDEFDILGDMKTMLTQQLNSFNDQKVKALRQKTKYEKLLGKFKTTGKENFLELVIQQKIASCDNQIRNIEMQLIPGNKAKELLKDYTFGFKARVDPRGTSFSLNEMMGMAMGGNYGS